MISPVHGDTEPSPFSYPVDNTASKSSDLVFGFIPQDVLAQAKGNSFLRRMRAIEEIHKLLKAQKGSALESHLPEFVKFAMGLLEDMNFKIQLITIELLRDLVVLCGSPVVRQLRPHVAKLLEKFGGMVVVRQMNMRLFASLLRSHNDNPSLLRALLKGLTNANFHVRENVAKVITYCVLLDRSGTIDYEPIVDALLSALDDWKVQVKRMAVEAFSALNHRIGGRLNDIIEQRGIPVTHRAILQERFRYPPPCISDDELVDSPFLTQANGTGSDRPSSSSVPPTGTLKTAPNLTGSLNTADPVPSPGHSYRRRSPVPNGVSGSTRPATTGNFASLRHAREVPLPSADSRQPHSVYSAQAYDSSSGPGVPEPSVSPTATNANVSWLQPTAATRANRSNRAMTPSSYNLSREQADLYGNSHSSTGRLPPRVSVTSHGVTHSVGAHRNIQTSPTSGGARGTALSSSADSAMLSPYGSRRRPYTTAHVVSRSTDYGTRFSYGRGGSLSVHEEELNSSGSHGQQVSSSVDRSQSLLSDTSSRGSARSVSPRPRHMYSAANYNQRSTADTSSPVPSPLAGRSARVQHQGCSPSPQQQYKPVAPDMRSTDSAVSANSSSHSPWEHRDSTSLSSNSGHGRHPKIGSRFTAPPLGDDPMLSASFRPVHADPSLSPASSTSNVSTHNSISSSTTIPRRARSPTPSPPSPATYGRGLSVHSKGQADVLPASVNNHPLSRSADYADDSTGQSRVHAGYGRPRNPPQGDVDTASKSASAHGHEIQIDRKASVVSEASSFSSLSHQRPQEWSRSSPPAHEQAAVKSVDPGDQNTRRSASARPPLDESLESSLDNGDTRSNADSSVTDSVSGSVTGNSPSTKRRTLPTKPTNLKGKLTLLKRRNSGARSLSARRARGQQTAQDASMQQAKLKRHPSTPQPKITVASSREPRGPSSSSAASAAVPSAPSKPTDSAPVAVPAAVPVRRGHPERASNTSTISSGSDDSSQSLRSSFEAADMSPSPQSVGSGYGGGYGKPVPVRAIRPMKQSLEAAIAEDQRAFGTSTMPVAMPSYQQQQKQWNSDKSSVGSASSSSSSARPPRARRIATNIKSPVAESMKGSSPSSSAGPSVSVTNSAPHRAGSAQLPPRGPSSRRRPLTLDTNGDRGALKVPTSEKRGRSASVGRGRRRRRTPTSSSAGLSRTGSNGSIDEPLTPGSFRDTSANYTPTAQLQPLPNADGALKKCQSDIKSKDWKKRFSALNVLRRLVVHHTDVVKPVTKQLMSSVHAELDSLRSALAKNALMCLTDCFSHLRKRMDSDLEMLVPSIMKRTTDSGFLGEEAHKALDAMIASCTDHRVMNALMNVSAHKSPAIRGKAALFIAKAISVLGSRVPHLKDYEKLVIKVCKFLEEGSIDIRSAGKQAVITLAQIDGVLEFQNSSKRFLSSRQSNAIKKVLDKGLDQHFLDLESPSSASRPNVTRMSSLSGNRKANHRMGRSSRQARRIASSPSMGSEHGDLTLQSQSLALSGRSDSQSSTKLRSSGRKRGPRRAGSESKLNANDAAQLQTVFSDLRASDWQTRVKGVEGLTEFVHDHPTAASGQAQKVFDQLANPIGDANSKVQMVALRAIPQIIRSFQDQGSVPASVTSLIQPLTGTLAATSVTTRRATSTAFAAIVGAVDRKTSLLEPFTNAVLYANSRVQPVMLDNLNAIVKACYEEKPLLVVKYVVPVAYKLAHERKLGIRNPHRLLVKVLFSLMGDELFQSTAAHTVTAADVKHLQSLV